MNENEKELIILQTKFESLHEELNRLKNSQKTIEHSNKIETISSDILNLKNEQKKLEEKIHNEVKDLNKKIDEKFDIVLKKLEEMSTSIVYSKGFLKAILIFGSVIGASITVLIKYLKP